MLLRTASTLEQSLVSTKKNLDRLTAAHDDLSTTNTSLTSSLEELRASVATLNDSQSSTSDRAAALVVSLEQKEAAAAAAHAAGDKLKMELESLRADAAQSEQGKQEAEEGWETSKGAVEEAQALLLSVTSELQKTKEEVLALESTLKGVHDEAVGTTAAKIDVESQNTLLQSSLDALKTQLDTLAASKASLEDQLVGVQHILKEKEVALDEFEKTTTKEVEAANTIVRDRNVALSAAVRKASKSERELLAIMAAGNERNEELDKLRSTISGLESEVARLRTGAEASATQVAALTDELERHVSEVEVLKGELGARKEETEEANRALEELKDVFARAQEELATKDAEIEEVRTTTQSPIIHLDGTPDPSSHPYDREYVDQLLQHHELDLSGARGQIRSLEERIFAAEDAGYRMNKLNGDLKMQVESMLETLENERERTRRKEREVEALRAAERDRTDSPAHAHVVPPPPKASKAPVASPSRQSVVHTSHDHTSHTHQPPPLQSHATQSHDAVHGPPSPSHLSPLPPTPPSRSSPRAYAHRRVASHLPSVNEGLVPGESGFPFASPSDQRKTVDRGPDPAPASLPRNLPPSTRHARKASLSMLKTRMQDELGGELSVLSCSAALS